MKQILFLLCLFLTFEGFPQSSGFKFSSDIPISENGVDYLNAWSGGFNAAQFNMADLDGDGIDELIVVDRNSSRILTFRYDGEEYIFAPEARDFLPDIGYEWAIFIDYDCDGAKDIFYYSDNGVNVYKNLAPGEWELVADPLKTTGFSGPINLVVNSSDIPGIGDIDGDGDLDIISYNFATGEDIRFHKNMSVESTGSCGTLEFEIVDRFWGEFKECNCNEYVFGESASCTDLNNGRVAHTGGKFLLLKDIDGDNDQDLFLTHSDCDDLAYFENEGDISQADMNDFVTQFPSQSDRISFHIYPIINFLDLDFDGQEEMIASSNIDFDFEFLSDFSHSTWLFDSLNNDLNLVRKNFLSNNMMDLGELSKPQFLDYDSDGDQDLFVAYNGLESSGKYYGAIALLKNEGNIFQPEFSLVERDFSGLSELGLHIPTARFIDYNQDQFTDLFITGYNSSQGIIESYILPGSENELLEFDVDNALQPNISLRFFEIPEFYDVDSDGDLDMITGSRDGSLALYENKGNFSFELASSDYLGVGRDFTLNRLNIWPEVEDLDRDGKPDMVISDTKEIIYLSDFLNNASPAVDTLLVYDSLNEESATFDLQLYNSMAFADLNNSGYSSLILGGSGGGLRFYENLDQQNDGGEALEITVYPNPLRREQSLKIRSFAAGSITIYNVNGQKLTSFNIAEKAISELDMQEWKSGVYLLFFISDAGYTQTKKLIISR